MREDQLFVLEVEGLHQAREHRCPQNQISAQNSDKVIPMLVIVIVIVMNSMHRIKIMRFCLQEKMT